MNGKRNCSIDIFRLFCAVLVVVVHTKPLTEFRYLGDIVTQVFPRIAVPFFLCVSGFYYIKSLMENKKVLKKQIVKLLKIYVFWSSIYILWDLLHVLVEGKSLITFIKSTIINFFVSGSYYHLWYIPALFFCLIISTLFFRFGKLKLLAYSSIFLYVLGLLGCSYFAVGNNIPFIRDLINWEYFNVFRRIVFMSLPFFMQGYFLHVLENKYKSLSNKALRCGIAVAVAGFLVEILFVVKMGIQKNIIITVFLYVLLLLIMICLLRNPMLKREREAFYAKRLSDLIYFLHPAVIIGLNGIGNFSPVVLFVLVTVSCITIGWLVIKLDNKWLNQLF